MKIAFTRLAKLDLDELIIHIGKDDPRAAVRIASRILSRIELLGEQPEIGRRGLREGTRELVLHGTRYIAAYRIDTARDEIQILRILHGSRQWPERF